MLKRIVLIAALLLATIPLLFAQPQDPQGDADNPVPLEGIEVLLIAGGVLGIGRLLTKNGILFENKR